MDSIRSLLAIAGRRLALARALDALSVGLIAACVVGIVAVVLVKTLPGGVGGERASAVLLAMSAALVLGGLVRLALVRATRPTDAQLALRIDERLKLDERLATALALERATDPYARAAVADAVAVASADGMAAKVRAAFPVRVDGRAFVALLVIAATIAADRVVPRVEWTSEEPAEVEPVALARQEAEEAIERIRQEVESAKALPNDVRDAVAGLAENAESKVGGEMDDPDDARREGIKRMGALQKRLDELRQSDEAKANAAIKKDLSGLEPQEGETAEFADALARGDFAAAKSELEELKSKLDGESGEAGAMSDAEKAAAQAALEKMAKSLESLAERQQSLKDELERAGLDGQLANNAEALERAIEQSQNLTEQQREQLRDAAKAAKASQQALKRMAQAAKQAAKPKSQQQGQQQGQQQSQQSQQGQQGQQGQRGSAGGNRGGGGNGAEDPNGGRFWENGTWAENQGPFTGGDFGDWAQRLRNIEDMVGDPGLRSEVSRIREEARSTKAEMRRHGKEPEWDLVRTRIYEPMIQLSRQISDEIARREDGESMVRLDRDPVPPAYSEAVRKYYEALSAEPVEESKSR